MKKKKQKSTMLLVILFLTGLSLLLYPSVANYWNSLHSSQAIASYAKEVSDLGKEEYGAVWQAASDYNRALTENTPGGMPSGEYNKLLNIGGNGIMGQIEIPAIHMSLPIYHGTSDAVLQTATGHLEWTSLPVGGESSHCVLSGHRGLPRAKLFTDLDRLSVGDVFYIRVLNEMLTYEVDQIRIVSPKDTSALQIEKGKDYCTLVTCTPYGINTHRLLVRGHRVDNSAMADTFRINPDAFQIEPRLVAAVMVIPMLLLYIAGITVRNGRTRRREVEANE
ncbi:MAG: class C sortase [Clostridiales bacterium]|nr:class C sortase [Candidatus Cacconaster stercorequi]